MISMSHPSRNLFVPSPCCVFMFELLKVKKGFECLGNKEFLTVKDILLQWKNSKLYSPKFRVALAMFFGGETLFNKVPTPM